MMRAEDSGVPFLPEPVVLATGVQHMAVMQQPVQDGRGDRRVAEEFDSPPASWEPGRPAAPVLVVLRLNSPEVLHQLVGPDEVGAVAALNGPLGQATVR